MANEEHLRILQQGADAWNRWRKEHRSIRPDLSEAILSEMNLREVDFSRANLVAAYLGGVNLSQANLSKANLAGATLIEANLWLANLSKADFRKAFLTGANLTNAKAIQVNLSDAYLSEALIARADLGDANLTRADLAVANITKTHLGKANLTGAHMGWTIVGDVNLSDVTGLETVIHRAPSTIGIDTILASRGRIPEVFLRGAGVPDEFITYARSLIGRAIEFYSCFISHSSKDQDFAERLYADLQDKGVRCYFAPKDIQGGRKLYEQIDEAIRCHDKLLLVLSENSMRSEWVKTEIRRARREEAKAGRRILFPISLAPFSAVQNWEAFDADIGKDMAVEVREYFIPDFSCWKQHDDYHKALTRLLRDLKADTPVVPAEDASH